MSNNPFSSFVVLVLSHMLAGVNGTFETHAPWASWTWLKYSFRYLHWLGSNIMYETYVYGEAFLCHVDPSLQYHLYLYDIWSELHLPKTRTSTTEFITLELSVTLRGHCTWAEAGRWRWCSSLPVCRQTSFHPLPSGCHQRHLEQKLRRT